MNKRGLVIGLLVMLAVITSGFTYAFWSSIDRDGNVIGNTVTIGEAKTATFDVTLDSSSTGLLVPVGQVGNSLAGAVEYKLFTFEVEWNDNFYTTGTLEVSESNVLLGGFATHAGLVNFAFQVGGDADDTEALAVDVLGGNGSTTVSANSLVTVFVLVTLTEPADQATYEAVFDKIITFTVDFEITSPAE